MYLLRVFLKSSHTQEKIKIILYSVVTLQKKGESVHFSFKCLILLGYLVYTFIQSLHRMYIKCTLGFKMAVFCGCLKIKSTRLFVALVLRVVILLFVMCFGIIWG